MSAGEELTAGEPPAARALTPFTVAVVVLLAFQPFVAFLEANRTQVEQPFRVFVYGAVVAGLGLAALAVLTRWLHGRAGQVAVAVALVITSIFRFSSWLDGSPQPGTQVPQILVWATLTVLVALLGYRLAMHAWFKQGLVIFAAVFVALPLVGYLSYRIGGTELASSTELPSVPEVVDPPNVYWFVLDEYARNDQLETYTGFDNDRFYEDLRDRGFVVSESSVAAYPRTHQSLSSTLQMDYVATPGNSVDNEFDELAPVVRGDNEVVRRFRAHGYQFVYSDSAAVDWSQCTDQLADVCLPAKSPFLARDELDQALLDLTPIGSLDLVPTPYTDPVIVVDSLAEAAPQIEEPFFLFAHVNAPHWPYRFKADCTPLAVPTDAHKLTLEERKHQYIEEIECLNPRVLEAVDRLVEDDPDAIIVIQSDHGSHFLVNWDLDPAEWSTDSITERFSVLSVARLPEGCEDLPFEGASLVNTFRLVFACIEGDDDPELLPTRYFLAPYVHLDEVTELDGDRVARLQPGS